MMRDDVCSLQISIQPAPVQFSQEMEQNGEIKIKDEVKEELSSESCQGRRDTMIAFFFSRYIVHLQVVVAKYNVFREGKQLEKLISLKC